MMIVRDLRYAPLQFAVTLAGRATYHFFDRINGYRKIEPYDQITRRRQTPDEGVEIELSAFGSEAEPWKWSPARPKDSIRHHLTMLSQRVEELRRERMLQNYNENFSELRYSQLHMPPPAEYNSLVQHVEQPWYNSYSHGEVQNGGTDYFSRGSENKTPNDWSSYPSDTESPFIPSQMNNSCGLDRISPHEVAKSYDPTINSDVLKHGRSSMSPYDGQYTNNQMGSILNQQLRLEGSAMQMANHQMISSTPDPLMINEVNGLLPNGVDSTPNHPDQTASTPRLKEEEMLPKLDLSINCQSANDSLSCNPRLMEKECGSGGLTNGTSGKDPMKLPGFHQTFGNITEIGRFSQHDDYFEVRPLPPEILDATPKLPEQAEPPPKRKPRGRKRKTPETTHQRVPPGGGYPSPEEPPPPPAPCLPPEPHPPPPSSHQWQYPPHHMDPHPHHYPHHHHHNQWRNGPHGPHPYNYHHHHQSHYHHQHYNPYNNYPPPPHHYNDCAPPPPHHYNSYNSYPPPSHQSAWHANTRDYNNVMVPTNYPGYV